MTTGRRRFLAHAATGGAAAMASALPAPAVAQGPRELTMVTTWPKNFPGVGTGAQRLADRITAMTEGRIRVQLYSAGELVGAFECFDAVAQGTADLWHGAAYYWQGKSPAFNFFTAVPFGLTADETNAWLYFGGGMELWDELAASFGLKPFPAGNTGAQMGGWFRNEVTSVDDFNGLKFRMPGLGGEVLRRMGAAVQSLPGGEIFPALQSGAIDATEWVGPWNDLAFGFHRIAKYYYYPGFHEPGSTLECVWNLNVWSSLSVSDQEIVKAACAAENDTMLAEYNARNADSLGALVSEHGVQLREFSDDIFAAFGKYSQEVLAEAGAADEMTGRVWESFSAFRRRAMDWTALADLAYAGRRAKALAQP